MSTTIKTKVFVYGTLKKGFGNHRLLQNSTFVGNARTHKKMRMFDGGFPYVLHDYNTEGVGQIIGQVYEIDHATGLELDYLEGVDHQHYTKHTEKVITDDGVELWCGVYLASRDTAKHLENGMREEMTPVGGLLEWGTPA